MSNTVRVLIHIPVGFLAIALAWVGWIYGLMFFIGFIAYEVLEQWAIKDHSYIDFLGALVGLGIGGMVIFLYKVVILL